MGSEGYKVEGVQYGSDWKTLLEVEGRQWELLVRVLSARYGVEWGIFREDGGGG